MTKRTLWLLPLLILVGCAGSQSKTMIGGNLFAQWRPTTAQLEADPSLEPVRWTHFESLQLGSIISMVLKQTGESPPKLEGEVITSAGPLNAALGAGGLIGAAVLFNPDPDETHVEGTSSADAKSESKAGSKSKSNANANAKASTKQSQGQGQAQGQHQGQKQGQKQGQRQGQKQGQAQGIKNKNGGGHGG